MTLADRLAQTLRELGVCDTDRVGVACSGGADSMALLHLVARTRPAVPVVALHVDHGLRDDSAADAAFVQTEASRLGLDCVVLAVAVDRRGSLEAAARSARYAALTHAAWSHHLSVVLTAHTFDDQAETVLHRVLRGGRLDGIAPRREIFVRPLLGVRRAELRAWLGAESLAWREDPSNDDVRHERNWHRRVVLPLLRERRPGVDEVLVRLAARARADDTALEALAAQAFAHAAIDDAGVLLPKAALPEAIATRVHRAALRHIGVDPAWSDLDAVAALTTGTSVDCGGVTVWRMPEGLAFMRNVRAPDLTPLTAGAMTEAMQWGVRVRVGSPHAPAWAWRCLASAEDAPLVLRTRHPGDRVATTGGTRKVQDVLVDAKVPRPLRDFVPLVATVSGPLAVVGLTRVPRDAALAVDVEPNDPTWSRKVLWNRAN